jgi:uncharacterized protein YoxC
MILIAGLAALAEWRGRTIDDLKADVRDLNRAVDDYDDAFAEMNGFIAADHAAQTKEIARAHARQQRKGELHEKIKAAPVDCAVDPSLRDIFAGLR